MLLVGMYICTLALENDWDLLGDVGDRRCVWLRNSPRSAPWTK